jgi:hypothetical protein
MAVGLHLRAVNLMPGQDGKPIARLTTDDLSRIWPPNFAHGGHGSLRVGNGDRKILGEFHCPCRLLLISSRLTRASTAWDGAKQPFGCHPPFTRNFP